uniref:B3/B4 tRNA-binding domain-containing protein n=1 Tax=Eiseniibacteriota bacterium TaxID=2212470 RepID=A0A832MN45_UNCEI
MSLGSRAEGLPLRVDEALRGRLALGLMEAEGLAGAPLPAGFDADAASVTDALRARHAEHPVTDVPGVAETRALFHALGVDPTKTRPSSEALLRRVLKGEGLPRVHPAVDVCNLCSLERQIPLGLYDRDQVHGPIVVRLGRPGEGYAGIRKQRVNLEGRLLLADDEGAFGAPTSDSARTAVSEGTRALVVVLFCPLARAAQLGAALEGIAARLDRWCGATTIAVRTVQ